MEIEIVNTEEIKNEMTEFNLFDADLTNTAIMARDNGKIVAFLQGEHEFRFGFKAMEIQSKSLGAGLQIVNWLKKSENKITAVNSGKDSWGFWKRLGFRQTKDEGYYGEFVWEE